jgi:oligoendopeptidase F
MTSPFYYIDYGIAQLGAVQLWKNSQTQFEKTVEQYIYALSLGAQRPLPDLFEAAGLTFDFSKEHVAALGKVLADEVEKVTF